MRLPTELHRLAPSLSEVDAAILIAALRQDAHAKEAYQFWRSQLVWEDLPTRWVRLLPLLHENLLRFGEQDELFGRVKGVRRFMWAKNLRLIELAKTVLGEFRTAGIDVVPLKGTSLVVAGLVDRSERPMNDIDVLVQPDQIKLAVAVLARVGFHPRFVSDRAIVERLMPERRMSGWPFLDAQAQEVDLHWNAMHLDRRPDSDRQLWASTGMADFEGLRLRVLSGADQLVNICAHGARDAAPGSLRWIADATFVLRRGNSMNWDAVIARGEYNQISAILARSLDLLRTLLDLPVPAEVIARLDSHASWPERVEGKILALGPDRRRRGVAGRFLELQEFRRGRPEIFKASAVTVLAHVIAKKAGTSKLLPALMRHVYVGSRMRRKYRRALVSDLRLELPELSRLPMVPRDRLDWQDDAMFLHGWSLAELSGRWTDGHWATLVFRLAAPVRQLPGIIMHLRPAQTPENPEMSVSVFINDEYVLTKHFTYGVDGAGPVHCEAPATLEASSLMIVTIEISHPCRPSTAVGEAPDVRRLGVCLSEIAIAPQNIQGRL